MNAWDYLGLNPGRLVTAVGGRLARIGAKNPDDIIKSFRQAPDGRMIVGKKVASVPRQMKDDSGVFRPGKFLFDEKRMYKKRGRSSKADPDNPDDWIPGADLNEKYGGVEYRASGFSVMDDFSEHLVDPAHAGFF